MKNKDIDNIMHFLREVAANNNRPWFQENKAWYNEVKGQFEDIVKGLLVRIGQFDDTITHLDVKDCTYRFYRDTRFSPDKSPYKRHLGAYISAKGKKSYHGGYYLHLEPDHSLLASGTWYLPSNILKEVRMSILEDLGSFREIVESPDFKAAYPNVGYESLKTMPKGFPKDFSHPEYLRIKVYSCYTPISNKLFESNDWLDEIAHIFEIGKPYVDFINDTIDDYE